MWRVIVLSGAYIGVDSNTAIHTHTFQSIQFIKENTKEKKQQLSANANNTFSTNGTCILCVFVVSECECSVFLLRLWAVYGPNPPT